MTSASTPTVPSVALGDGKAIPQLGFGVWQVPDDEAETAVLAAFEAGYRHIDTAAIYGNERGVGRAIAKSGLDRDEIYITTKLWNSDHLDAATAYSKSLHKLGLDTVDLYLVHWAAPPLGTYRQAWEGLVSLHQQGLVRSIGVSNFHQPHVDQIVADTGVTPVLNQIELHPYLQQRDMRAYNAGHGIVTEAWSPLGQGKGLLDDPDLAAIASTKGVSPAQVALAWQLAIGNVVIPKSVTPSRIVENLASVDVTLTAEEIEQIEALDRGERFGSDPDTAAFA
ncbi:MAG TPA: aldo/keto reductase [Ilumatobacteraceae bacterium]|nr:aldo/keto reductase [Ilumatobacteraceae bacterium]